MVHCSIDEKLDFCQPIQLDVDRTTVKVNEHFKYNLSLYLQSPFPKIEYSNSFGSLDGMWTIQLLFHLNALHRRIVCAKVG